MRIAFLPYEGNLPYIYLGFSSVDEGKIADVVNELALRNVRLFYALPDLPANQKAHAIRNAALTVFFVSEEGCNELSFRNEVNYALSEKKPALYFCIDQKTPGHGLNMQLSTVRELPFSETAADTLLRSGDVTQEMIGTVPEKRKQGNVRKWIFGAVVGLAVLGFLVGAFFSIRNRIAYYRSPAYIYREVSPEAELVIDSRAEESIEALAGKTVKKLDLSGSGLKDVSGLVHVKVTELDLSYNDLTSLYDLRYVEGLEAVYLDQSQLILADDLTRHGISVYVTLEVE